MATFLFVHGAWHSGRCFDHIVRALAQKGHDALAPDLPGINGTEAELAAVTLECWGRFIADLAVAQQSPVILCGHSRGGSVISTAAEQAPQVIGALVYICAFLLPDGDSSAAFKAKQHRNDEILQAISVIGANAGTKIKPAAGLKYFYNRTPREEARAALQFLTSDPYKPSRTPLCLTHERFGSLPRHYLECSDDLVISLREQRVMHRTMRVESVETLKADHSPFLSNPLALTRALLRIANQLEAGKG